MKVSRTYSTSSDWVKLFGKNAEIYRKNLSSIGRIITAFNVNTDEIVKTDFSKLELASVKSTCLLPKYIGTMEDFKRGLVYSVVRGAAVELKIGSKALYNWLLKNVKTAEKRIGGQTGIVANNSSSLGVKQVVAYAEKLSREQASLFDKKVLYPAISNGRLKLKNAKSAGKKSGSTRVNIIFEYRKGTRVKLEDKTVTIPRSNRLIVSPDWSKLVPLFPDNLLIPELFSNAAAAFLSGYHHIEKKESNKLFKKCAGQLDRIRALRCPIHLEYVDIHKEWVRKGLLSLLIHVDSFGLNEVEALNLSKTLGHSDLAKEITDSNFSAEALAGAGLMIAKKFRLRRVSIHHLHFTVSLTRKDYDIPLERVLHANIFGTRVVNARGVYGKNFASRLKMKNFALNKIGVSEASKSYEDGEYNILVIPNFEVGKPLKYSVGLGDTISSAVFFGEHVK